MAVLVVTAVVASIGPAAVAAGGSEPLHSTASASRTDTPTFSGDAWLTEVNYYRTASGLRPVTVDATWAAGLQAHLTYLADTPAGYLTGQYASAHIENPASPYYTTAGATEGASSDLIQGAVGETPVELIDDWLTAPLHAIGILRPDLRRVAFAYDPTTGDAGLDILSGLTYETAAPTQMLFPGTGSTTNLTTFGGEYPDPLTSCSWTAEGSVGLPLIAMLATAPAADLSASVSGPGGDESTQNGSLCVVDANTYHSTTPIYGPTGLSILQDTDAVLLIPRAPLSSGEYTANIDQSGKPPISWSFTVDAPPPAPPTVTTFSTTPPSTPTGSSPLGGIPMPVVGMAAAPGGNGYWIADAQGAVSAHGDAGFYGSMAGRPLNAPITHIVATADGGGYWLVAADGGTFAFGDAGFYGSMGGRPLNAPVVDIAPTKDGGGYWLVASDGGIFAFGDAHFSGSMGGQPLNRPVVGIAPDDVTGGYWEVATDGGIFAFGAPFYGSMGAQPLNSPVNGMEPTADDDGYRFVAGDGGIFAFGDAPFYGSMGGSRLNEPIVGMAGDPATDGYWLVAADGGVFSFDAPFFGAD